MHELSIALSILDIAAEESRRHGSAPVKAIHIRLGLLSGVVREALESAFELAREDSPFADCRLVVDEVPVIIHCAACQAEQPADSIQLLCCARCGTPTANVVRGREMDVTALEIEEPALTDRPTVIESKA